jgi:putative transposase
MIEATFPEIEVLTSTKTACRLLGMARATLYRHRTPRIFGPVPAPIPGIQPTALSSAERAHALHVLNSDRFADLMTGAQDPVERGNACQVGSFVE